MTLARRIDYAKAEPRVIDRSMISRFEFAALSSAAEQIWSVGANRQGVIVDAGSFIGASTLALCEGLSRSSLDPDERAGRIWSYDLFRAIPAIAEKSLKGEGLKVGDSFRYLYDEAIRGYEAYVRTFEGDIREAEKPLGPISLLFLDVLWDTDVTIKLADAFYPHLVPGESIVVHQDFVYPYYPWVVISMGRLQAYFSFAAHIESSTIVFDVLQEVPVGALEGLADTPVDEALGYYDQFIGLIEAPWGKGLLWLGKALYLASVGRSSEAAALIDWIVTEFARERRVVSHAENVGRYVNNALAGKVGRLGKDAVVVSSPVAR